MLFFKRLSFAPKLAMCLKATIQSQSFSFQAELFPVHSPLLRESCLVYFPPLTYMLKFSRFADLTSCCCSCTNHHTNELKFIQSACRSWQINAPRKNVAHSNAHRSIKVHMQWSRHTSRDYPEVQYAFKDPLIHGILQFTMIITLCCVLHRCLNRDIRRWKLCHKHWSKDLIKHQNQMVA